MFLRNVGIYLQVNTDLQTIPDNGGSMFLRNVGIYLQIHTDL
jgi:hypothetical protein